MQVTRGEEFDSAVQDIEDIVQEHAGADPSEFLQYLQACLPPLSDMRWIPGSEVVRQLGPGKDQRNVGLSVD